MAPPPSGSSASQLHLWRIRLDVDADIRTTLAATLSDDERARAARFRFAVDHDRFVTGRGRLRSIIASYLATDPASLAFVTNPQGKPALHDAHTHELWFNLAHSAGTALLVVGRTERLGVDVEHVRPGFADDEIAERFFAPSEVAALRALPHEVQMDAFFRCWTRKEAYIKACGGGLHIPLDSFTVAFTPHAAAALTWVAGGDDEPQAWTILDVSDAAPGCVAAVAVRAPSERVELPVLIDLHG